MTSTAPGPLQDRRTLRLWRAVTAGAARPVLGVPSARFSRGSVCATVDDLVERPFGRSILAGVFSPDPSVFLAGGFSLRGPLKALSSQGNVEVDLGEEGQSLSFVGSTNSAENAVASARLGKPGGPVYFAADMILNAVRPQGSVMVGGESSWGFAELNAQHDEAPTLTAGVIMQHARIAASVSTPVTDDGWTSPLGLISDSLSRVPLDVGVSLGRLHRDADRRFELSFRSLERFGAFRGSVLVEQFVNGRLVSFGGDITVRRQDNAPRELRLGGIWHVSPRTSLHLAGHASDELVASGAVVRRLELRNVTVDVGVSARLPLADISKLAVGVSLVFLQ